MTALLPSDPNHSDHLISTGGLRARRVVMPKTNLRLKTKEQLIGLCRENRDEVCGFLTEREEVFLVKNVHEQPRYNFFMDLESLQTVVHTIYYQIQSGIIGIFHTHPNNQPWPSPRDLVGWPNPDLKWRYWISTQKELIEWETYIP